MIYVMIAAYQDEEIIPTLVDLFSKAVMPDEIRVCVCWQGDDMFVPVIKSVRSAQIDVLSVPPGDSLGLGWARNLSQSRYNGEEFCMQLDAHHRFKPGWDTWHIDQIRRLQTKGYFKPVLTAYAGNYDFVNGIELCERPSYLTSALNGFSDQGRPTIPFQPHYIPQHVSQPVPARFASGHYLFTVGEYAREYIHDPYTTFWGEELAMSVRLYTMGYDLFHPHQLQVFHRYVRYAQPEAHYVDHHNALQPLLDDRQTEWFKRLRFLTGQPGEKTDPGTVFGLGKVRSLIDYELFSEIRFSTQTVYKQWIHHIWA